RSSRTDCPSALPSSGSLPGPKTINTITRISIRCVGWSRPSNIVVFLLSRLGEGEVDVAVVALDDFARVGPQPVAYDRGVHRSEVGLHPQVPLVEVREVGVGAVDAAL